MLRMRVYVFGRDRCDLGHRERRGGAYRRLRRDRLVFRDCRGHAIHEAQAGKRFVSPM